MTYSQDLRKKTIQYIESGHTQAEAASVFGVTSRTIWNWIQRKKKGSLKPKQYVTSPRKIDNERLISLLKENPDAYLREIADEFNVDPSAIFYACKRLKITLKKRRQSTKSGVRKKEKPLSKG
jgi:transposase